MCIYYSMLAIYFIHHLSIKMLIFNPFQAVPILLLFFLYMLSAIWKQMAIINILAFILRLIKMILWNHCSPWGSWPFGGSLILFLWYHSTLNMTGFYLSKANRQALREVRPRCSMGIWWNMYISSRNMWTFHIKTTILCTILEA